MADIYGAVDQIRTPIAAPDTWVALVIPVGAKDALLASEDPTVELRVSSVDSIAAASEGVPVAPAGAVIFKGTAAAAVTVYVAAKQATTAILFFVKDKV
jgi:hypothetical protein